MAVGAGGLAATGGAALGGVTVGVELLPEGDVVGQRQPIEADAVGDPRQVEHRLPPDRIVCEAAQRE